MTIVVGAKTPEQGEALEKFGEFLGLKQIEYQDLGNGENYVLIRSDGKMFTIRVRGNRYDGGFLSVKQASHSDVLERAALD